MRKFNHYLVVLLLGILAFPALGVGTLHAQQKQRKKGKRKTAKLLKPTFENPPQVRVPLTYDPHAERPNGIDSRVGPAAGAGGAGQTSPETLDTKPVNIIFKPEPEYTEEARRERVSGVVRLRVTFAASGEVTAVTPLNRLPFGLTEKAIEAARKIKFEPAKKGGEPATTTKTVQFAFNY